ncbi:MAG: hypothetical protein HC875_34150 [Anaerolineales bacterium]|nr:hypothetical protein [Anaerolineales bacterium]
MSNQYKLSNIRALLNDGFTPEELRRFCYEEPDFRPVHDRLTQSSGKDIIIDELLTYSNQRLKIEALLNWVKKHNLAMYEKHQPYRDTEVASSEAIDFVIGAVLLDDLNALLEKLPAYWKLNPPGDDIPIYYAAKLPFSRSKGKRGTYNVRVFWLGQDPSKAKSAMDDAIKRWRPRYVLLLSIIAGVSLKGVDIGDIILADGMVSYQTEGTSKTKFSMPPEFQQSALPFGVHDLIGTNWTKLIGSPRPDGGNPVCHKGIIASGDKLVNYHDPLKKYDIWSKVIGIETETPGIAKVVRQSTGDNFWMIGGVYTLADKKVKPADMQQWRPYAHAVAAAYTVALLQSGPVPL